MPEPREVLQPSAEYAGLEKRRALPRALMGRTPAMRAAGKLYLPRWPAEDEGRRQHDGTPDGYLRRLHSATLEPAFPDAVLDLAGRVFSRPILLDDLVPLAIRGNAEGSSSNAGRAALEQAARRLEELAGQEGAFPAISAMATSLRALAGNQGEGSGGNGGGGDAGAERLEGLWETVDNQRDGNQFCHEWFRAAVAEGEACILIDHTPAPLPTSADGTVTQAQERRANARPYAVLIPNGNMLEALETTVGGKKVWQRIRYISPATEPDGRYKTKENRDRVKILERGTGIASTDAKAPSQFATWRVIEVLVVDGVEKEVERESGTFAPHIEVPFIRLRLTEDGTPPLDDLAHNNVRHWQKQSAYDHNLYVSAVNIFTATGLSGPEVDKITEKGLGSGRLWTASVPDAKFGNIQWDGKVSEALAKDLEELRESMSRQAREPLVRRTGTQTATAESIAEARAHSLLESWALKLQDGVNLLLYDFAVYLSGSTTARGGKCMVNRRYGMAGSPPEILNAVLVAQKQGALSKRTVMDVFESQGALPDDFDAEAELERLALESGMASEAEELRARVDGLESVVNGRAVTGDEGEGAVQ